MRKILLLILILLAIGLPVNAQSKVVEPIVIRGNVYSACEENAASFDNLANILHSSDERLFIIARLGKGESSRDLNRRRLYNVRTYFKENGVLDAKRFVFAEGDRVDGVGRVEFYIGCHLMQISLVKRSRDICVDCCDYPDPTYYGTGKKDKPKRRSR